MAILGRSNPLTEVYSSYRIELHSPPTKRPASRSWEFLDSGTPHPRTLKLQGVGRAGSQTFLDSTGQLFGGAFG
jgi:hypothetical protein